MINRIHRFIMIHKKEFLPFIVFVVFLCLFFVSYAFGAVDPVKSITVQSENTDYNTQEEGSWQLTKSSKWDDYEVANVRLLVQTNAMNNNYAKDVFLVVPTSASIPKDFLEMKEGISNYIEDFLTDSNNRISLIFYNSDSTIVSDFANDKTVLLNAINDMGFTRGCNYYYPFVNIDTILKDYQHVENCETMVAFITNDFLSGLGNVIDTMIRYLKDSYSYLTINNIAYGTSHGTAWDNSFSGDYSLLNSLNIATSLNFAYDHFQVIDYIDSNFVLESEEDVNVDAGSFELTSEDGHQKVVWNLDGLLSGQFANLTMKLRLKSSPEGENVTLSTNYKEIVNSQIMSLKEDVESTKTPILVYDYQVTYEENAPEGCSVGNVPDSENHAVFSTVSISDTIPECRGYEFKGWEILDEDITKINDDYFVMPERDVVIRAKWSKIDVSKSMSGTVFEGYTLYEIMKDTAVIDNTSSEFVSSSTGIDFSQRASDTNGKGVYIRAGTENDEYPILYYRGDVDNNHVKFGGFCWLMVRTTDTGGTKLIYDGEPDSNGYCNNNGDASTIGYSSFNDNFNSLSDVGYMYGNRYPYTHIDTMSEFMGREFLFGNDVIYSNGRYILQNTTNVYGDDLATGLAPPPTGYHYFCLEDGSSSCSTVYYWIRFHYANYYLYSLQLDDGKKIEDVVEEATIESSNEFDSTIKTYIDTWYGANMTEYTEYLEDTIWCNDRSIYEKGSFDKGGDNNYLYFSGYHRLDMSVPSFTCGNLVDSFTVSSEKGNGKLTYPIAMLTKDETIFSGYVSTYPVGSSSLYLTGQWWLLTPASFAAYSGSYGSLMSIANDGNSDGTTSSYRAVRPAISLRGDLKVTSGIGTSEEPYELLLD